MSKIAGYLLVLIVALGLIAGVLSLIALAFGWLAPIATAGAFAPDFIQSLGIVTLLALVASFFRSK